MTCCGVFAGQHHEIAAIKFCNLYYCSVRLVIQGLKYLLGWKSSCNLPKCADLIVKAKSSIPFAGLLKRRGAVKCVGRYPRTRSRLVVSVMYLL